MSSSWVLTSATVSDWQSIASDASGQHLAACVNGGGIYTSSNYGSTWTQQSDAPTNAIWFSIASSSDGINLAAVVQGGGIYTSSNSGLNWTLQTNGAPTNAYWYSIASSSDGSLLAAVVFGGGIYVSLDSGSSWAQTSAPTTYWFSIASDASGQHLAACVFNGGIWTSLDYGTTWTQTSAPTDNWNSIASSSSGQHLAAVIGGGGIYTYESPPIPCFKKDTQILTDNGYRFIQDLRKGDLIKTLQNDFIPIDMIGKRDMFHPAQKERIKDQLYKCSKEQYPEIVEDLIITGGHSILVDNFTSEEQKANVIEFFGDVYFTDEKYRLLACVDNRASVYEIPGNYTIYHLALENNDYYMNYGIYANGLLVETCSKQYLKELSNMELIE